MFKFYRLTQQKNSGGIMDKMKFLLCVLALSLALFPSSGYSKSLNIILPGLLNQHERIKAAEDRRDSAIHRLREAYGGWYPRVDLNADAGHESVRDASNNDTYEVKDTQQLKTTQLLTDFGKTSSTVERARNELEGAKAGLLAVRQGILLEGIVAYLNVIKTREQLFYAKKSESNLQRQNSMEERLVKKKAGISSDVLQTRSQLAGSRALRVTFEGAFEKAKIRFKTVFKEDLTESEIKDFNLPELPASKLPETLDQAIETALKSNPIIHQAQYNVKTSEQDLVNRKSTYYPNLNLFAEGNRRMNNSGEEGDKLELYAGVELTYNFYKGGSDRAAIKAAQSNLSEAKNLLTETEWITRQDTRNAWQDHITASGSFKYLQEQADIMGEFLSLARKERKLGTRSLLDVLNGEVSYINAISLAVSAKIDMLTFNYSLLRATGKLDMTIF